jgi:hypothetical protein
MAQIAVACGRSDLFAFYGDSIAKPVIGFDDRGRALVLNDRGVAVAATQARIWRAGTVVRFQRLGVSDDRNG